MRQATSKEVKNAFGKYLRASTIEPVTITKNDTPVAVIISIEEYERLNQLEDAYWIAKADAAAKEGFIGTDETQKYIQTRLHEG